jgi:hypothetical protein
LKEHQLHKITQRSSSDDSRCSTQTIHASCVASGREVLILITMAMVKDVALTNKLKIIQIQWLKKI